MLRSVIGRSLAKSTAAGTVLAVAGLVGPAAVVSVPSLSLVACRDNYPNPIRTTTRLTLTDSFVEYGTRQRARVSVTSTAGRRPTGSVRFVVDGRSWDVPLTRGEASKGLPRGLDANDTYNVRARFVPDCATGQFAPSSDRRSLTVFKADTRIGSVLAPDIRRGQRFVVRSVVGTGTKSPHGKAKVVIRNGGKTLKQRVDVVPIGGGDSVIRANFRKKVRKPGTWNVKIVYLGSDDCKKSRTFASFKVRR